MRKIFSNKKTKRKVFSQIKPERQAWHVALEARYENNALGFQ